MSHHIVTAYSTHPDPDQAVTELYQQLASTHLGFVLFFCSAEYDLDALAIAFNHTFIGIPLSGCTTAGEITPMGYTQGAIVAIGFSERHFMINASLIEVMETFSLVEAQSIVEAFIDAGQQQFIAPIKGNSFALTLIDGLSVQEEQVLATLSSALGSIPHFGGSAGDDIHLTNTHVFAKGAFHTNAAVVLLFNTDCAFEVFSTHHLKHQQARLVVTEADRESRRVMELNAEPAAVEYARMIGVDVDALTPTLFALHPLAVRIGDHFYLRSIQQVNADLSLTFYCAVENGIVLTQMSRGDMLAELAAQFSQLNPTGDRAQLILGCDCIFRRLELEHDGLIATASSLLQQHNMVGFNTYGEHLHGVHMNQTLTGVAIGEPRHG